MTHGKAKEATCEAQVAPGAARRRRPRAPATEAEVNRFAPLAALLAVAALSMPEAWAWLTAYDTWAADQIAIGLLHTGAGALLWMSRPDLRAACAVLVVMGAMRSVCVAIWPDASDAGGSIFDKETGIPGTLVIAGLAAWAADRKRRE